MIPVGQLPPGDQWDQTLIDALLDGTLYPHGLDTRRYTGYPKTDGCVLVVPGRYFADRINQINEAITGYSWLLLIRTGDEEDLFDIHQIHHPNAKFWVQTPRTGLDYGTARLFGVGHTPHFNELPSEPNNKPAEVFLSAQDTHSRRHECFKNLKPWNDQVTATEGFTQGIPPAEYAERMCAARIAPCPAGPASPDTFRVWEALQAHTIPIADDITPGYPSEGYWRMLFPDVQFPIITNYESLPGYIGDQLRLWPENANRITAWYMRYKRQLAHWLLDDLEALGAL